MSRGDPLINGRQHASQGEVIRVLPWCRQTLLGCAVSASLLVASADAGDPKLSLSWRLIDNLPDNRFQAELTLKNDGAVPLDGNWALYFNSASQLVPASVAEGYRLSHINGEPVPFPGD